MCAMCIVLCKLHHAHCTMHIAPCILQYAHCTMHIALCTLHYAHCTHPPRIFENSGIFLKIVENLNFAIWKKVFLNFIGPPQLNQERYSALVFFYWTTTEVKEKSKSLMACF